MPADRVLSAELDGTALTELPSEPPRYARPTPSATAPFGSSRGLAPAERAERAERRTVPWQDRGGGWSGSGSLRIVRNSGRLACRGRLEGLLPGSRADRPLLRQGRQRVFGFDPYPKFRQTIGGTSVSPAGPGRFSSIGFSHAVGVRSGGRVLLTSRRVRVARCPLRPSPPAQAGPPEVGSGRRCRR